MFFPKKINSDFTPKIKKFKETVFFYNSTTIKQVVKIVETEE